MHYDTASSSVVPSLLQRSATAFGASGFASYIWICAKIVSRFGNEEGLEVREAIKGAFELINNQVFSLLKVQEPSDIPDGENCFYHCVA
jgi:hypothetical protein